MGRIRTTWLRDTTYGGFSSAGVWDWFPDSIVFPTTRQFPLDAARVERETLTIFSGGFTSGGTLYFYEKPKR